MIVGPFDLRFLSLSKDRDPVFEVHGPRALQQFYSALFAICLNLVGPDANLGFADMGFAQKEHTKTRLTNTAAKSLCEFTLKQA